MKIVADLPGGFAVGFVGIEFFDTGVAAVELSAAKVSVVGVAEDAAEAVVQVTISPWERRRCY